jgi:hypothetical protein
LFHLLLLLQQVPFQHHFAALSLYPKQQPPHVCTALQSAAVLSLKVHRPMGGRARDSVGTGHRRGSIPRSASATSYLCTAKTTGGPSEQIPYTLPWWLKRRMRTPLWIKLTEVHARKLLNNLRSGFRLLKEYIVGARRSSKFRSGDVCST